MLNEKLEIRGISRKDIIKYIEQLGGVCTENQLMFSGDHWSCEVFEEESFFMLQSNIPKVKIVFYGEKEDYLKEVLKAFRKKTFRAGG